MDIIIIILIQVCFCCCCSCMEGGWTIYPYLVFIHSVSTHFRSPEHPLPDPDSCLLRQSSGSAGHAEAVTIQYIPHLFESWVKSRDRKLVMTFADMADSTPRLHFVANALTSGSHISRPCSIIGRVRFSTTAPHDTYETIVCDLEKVRILQPMVS